jgi:hypothetical protein
LVFLAADQRRLDDLESGVAEFLAWRSIDEEATELNLTAQQASQARTKRADAERAVGLRLGDTYQWLLVPGQPDPLGEVIWDAIRVDGQAGLAVRAGQRLVNDSRLYTEFAPVLLRMRLDSVLASLWEAGHVTVGELWQAFSRYLYLPRLRNIQVLLETVRQGSNSTDWVEEGFASAESVDETSERFVGLVGSGLRHGVTASTLIVAPSSARAQLAEDSDDDRDEDDVGRRDDEDARDDRVAAAKRFFGTVTLNPERLGRDAGRVAQEVVTHLASLADTKVKISLDIDARRDEGFPDSVVRIVTENAKALRFLQSGFDEP